MGILLAARVKETTTTEGTGTLTLAGAPTGYQSFLTAFGNGNKCYYSILDGSAWEYGLGTISTGNFLARDVVLNSSAGGSKISLTAGSKQVICAIPPECCISNGYVLLPDGSTTPSVLHGRFFVSENTNATTITNFTGGIDGQEITILAKNANVSIDLNANFKLSGGINDWNGTTDDTISLVHYNGIWYEKSRTAN